MWVIPSPWGTLSDSTAPIAPNNGPNWPTNPAPPAWNAPLIPPKIGPACAANAPGRAAATAADTGAIAGEPGKSAPTGAPVAHINSGIPFAVYPACTAAVTPAVTAGVKAAFTYPAASAATAAPKSPGILEPTKAYTSPSALKFVKPVLT